MVGRLFARWRFCWDGTLFEFRVADVTALIITLIKSYPHELLAERTLAKITVFDDGEEGESGIGMISFGSVWGAAARAGEDC